MRVVELSQPQGLHVLLEGQCGAGGPQQLGRQRLRLAIVALKAPMPLGKAPMAPVALQWAVWAASLSLDAQDCCAIAVIYVKLPVARAALQWAALHVKHLQVYMAEKDAL